MNYKEIEYLVACFWKAIKEAIRQHAFPERPRTTIYSFPRGCCEIGSTMLAQYLLENGVSTIVVRGEYEDQPHEWLETRDGLTIDITVGQLKWMPDYKKYNLTEYYVGPYIPFYDLFDEDRIESEFRGLEEESDNYKRLICPLYETIVVFLG